MSRKIAEEHQALMNDMLGSFYRVFGYLAFHEGLNKDELASRIRMDRKCMDRIFRNPEHMTVDDLFDLFLGMGTEIHIRIGSAGEKEGA